MSFLSAGAAGARILAGSATREIAKNMVKLASTFARYRISVLGVKGFVKEMVMFYLWSELVDFTAKYSTFVRDNQGFITILGSVGIVGRNTIVSKFAARAASGAAGASVRGGLFAKIKLSGNAASIVKAAQAYTVKATADGVRILRGGRDYLALSSSGDRVKVAIGAGCIGAAALMASTLGGDKPTSRQDWEATGENLALQAAMLDASADEFMIRDYFRGQSPYQTLNSAPLQLRNIEAETVLSQDLISRIMMRSLTEQEDAVPYAQGVNTSAFYDESGDLVIRVGGKFFSPQYDKGALWGKDDTFVLMSSEPTGSVRRTQLSEHDQLIYEAIRLKLGDLSRAKHYDFVRIGKTNRFMSDLVIPERAEELGILNGLTSPISVALGFILITDDKGNLSHIAMVGSKNSHFSSSQTNIMSRYGETTGEAVSATLASSWNSVRNFFSADEPAVQEVAFMAPGVHRSNDLIVVDTDLLLGLLSAGGAE